jgi:hypothetical protein
MMQLRPACPEDQAAIMALIDAVGTGSIPCYTLTSAISGR